MKVLKELFIGINTYLNHFQKLHTKKLALDPAFQGVNRLFVLAFEDTRADEPADAPAPRHLVAKRVVRDSYRKYFVPRVDITSYNVLIDGRNFYDQPINDSIRKNMMKLERSQLEKEIITQLDVY